LNIHNSNFANNTATTKGGAISYDLYKPVLGNNHYEGNQASYGDNFSSYVHKIKIKQSTSDSIVFDSVGSGIEYETPFTLAFYDGDDQIVTTESASQIIISGNSTDSSVLGTNAVKVNNGEALFDSIIFVSEPGKNNVLFDIKSPALDLTRLRLVFGSTYEQEKLVANFRWCQPGEQLTSQNI
jgi:predicted outer membrane repeat protein